MREMLCGNCPFVHLGVSFIWRRHCSKCVKGHDEGASGRASRHSGTFTWQTRAMELGRTSKYEEGVDRTSLEITFPRVPCFKTQSVRTEWHRCGMVVHFAEGISSETNIKGFGCSKSPKINKNPFVQKVQSAFCRKVLLMSFTTKFWSWPSKEVRMSAECFPNTKKEVHIELCLCSVVPENQEKKKKLFTEKPSTKYKWRFPLGSCRALVLESQASTVTGVRHVSKFCSEERHVDEGENVAEVSRGVSLGVCHFAGTNFSKSRRKSGVCCCVWHAVCAVWCTSVYKERRESFREKQQEPLLGTFDEIREHARLTSTRQAAEKTQRRQQGAQEE